MIESPIIYLIDDDCAVARFVTRILSDQNWKVISFSSGEEFFASESLSSTGCVVCDLRLPGIQGTEIPARLQALESPLAFVIISGKADVATAVQLMKSGVVTVLEKPFTAEQLVAAVHEGLACNQRRLEESQRKREVRQRLELLTADEWAILDCLTKGLSHKAITAELNLSPRTVDRRRQSILQKMQLASIPEVIVFVASANLGRAG